MVDSCSKADLRAVKLIQARELYGNVIASSKGKWNFKEEFQNLLASKPVVCSLSTIVLNLRALVPISLKWNVELGLNILVELFY